MARDLYRPALWAVLFVLLVSLLATIQTAQAASSTYTLTGYVEQPGGASPPPVPAGVTVDLISRATGTVYTTTVANGGQFTFTGANTGGALAPGYWGVQVPAQANVSLSGCAPCAVLPAAQSPSFAFVNSTALTSVLYPTYVTNVTIVPYTATLTGKVFEGGAPQSGAHLYLLDPTYNGLVLAQNNTTASGTFTVSVPAGTWVLETALPGPTTQFNYTSVTIAKHQTEILDTNISTYLVSGYSNIAGNPSAHVPTAGNVTLYDPTNHLIYSATTAPGGYYAIGTYPGDFVAGTQEFDVILSSIGYQSSWFALNVTPTTPTVQRNVLVPAVAPSELGNYTTTLNFTGVNPLVGNGTVNITTVATLGNDTTFPTLANASVGQLWGQLGLDLAGTTVFPATDLPAVEQWFNASGPFFPIAQASTAINSSVFVGPTSPQTVTSFSSTCTATCGLNSPAGISVAWSSTYALNSSIAKNVSSYTISFNFKHPTSSNVYNYSLVLPAGYVLAADTQAPANTKLVAGGPDNTWTKFTLSSLPSPTSGGAAKFTIVKYSTLTANVNISVQNFAFSSANILNLTRDNYTAIVGLGQNVTFSALNSTYPAGTNGTKFVWNFGDGSPTTTTTTATAYHTYTAATGASNYSGSVTVTSSAGLVDSVNFFVWVATGPVVAGIDSNATAGQTFQAGGTTYYWVNWSTTLLFNATPSYAAISPTAPVANVISVASYAFTGSGFKFTGQNFSRSLGVSPFKNWSYTFLGAGAYLSSGTVNGTSIPFLGWQYTLTVTVWDGTGQSATASVVILVNDTQKPVAAIQLLNANGVPVTGSGLVEGANFTAKVLLSSVNATDPNNGSIVKYFWHVSNSGNSSVNLNWNTSSVRPYPYYWLAPQTSAYTVNLTVTDRAGNVAWTTASLQVSVNSTTRPVLSAGPLNVPSGFTVGTTATIWVNITNTLGTKSVAHDVQVAFFLLSPSGTGSRSYVGGAPHSVKFYNYTGGVVNTVPMASGTLPNLYYNQTVRAEITWNPSTSGNYQLYANASATNEYAGDYHSGPQQSSVAISVNPNPTTQLLEYAAIAVAVVVVIALIVFYYRRRGRAGAAKPSSSSKSGLERSKKPSDDDEDDDA